MSHNTFGHLFRVTTWGESHGPALGCVVDGCPAGIPLTEADVQIWLEKRRPGQGKFVTQRQEPDAVRILSGVFSDERHPDQVTTGTRFDLPRLRALGASEPRVGEHVFTVGNSAGQAVARFGWVPNEPGASIVRTVLPKL